MLHLTKLAVGIRDIAHLREVQAERTDSGQELRHRTRNSPRRRDELLDGGSMYWVIGGATVVRQRLRDVVADRWDDGTECAALILDATLIPVEARQTRPFQGWRYLDEAAAPPDLGARRDAQGLDELPPRLLRELRALCLL
jgi:hypothetical protein